MAAEMLSQLQAAANTFPTQAAANAFPGTEQLQITFPTQAAANAFPAFVLRCLESISALGPWWKALLPPVLIRHCCCQCWESISAAQYVGEAFLLTAEILPQHNWQQMLSQHKRLRMLSQHWQQKCFPNHKRQQMLFLQRYLTAGPQKSFCPPQHWPAAKDALTPKHSDGKAENVSTTQNRLTAQSHQHLERLQMLSQHKQNNMHSQHDSSKCIPNTDSRNASPTQAAANTFPTKAAANTFPTQAAANTFPTQAAANAFPTLTAEMFSQHWQQQMLSQHKRLQMLSSISAAVFGKHLCYQCWGSNCYCLLLGPYLTACILKAFAAVFASVGEEFSVDSRNGTTAWRQKSSYPNTDSRNAFQTLAAEMLGKHLQPLVLGKYLQH